METLKFKHFVFLNVLDVLTTWYGLTYLHLTEINPFANSMFQDVGLVFALVSLKFVGLIVIYLSISFYPLKIKKLALNIICFMCMLVVANNIYQIIKVI